MALPHRQRQLFHATLLTRHDLPNIQSRLSDQPTVRLYHIQDNKEKEEKTFSYLLCHRVIYEAYLAKHGNLQHVNGVYYFYCSVYGDQAQIILICLYLKHLGMIDEAGYLNSQYTVNLPGVYNSYFVRDFARYHELDWLCRFYALAQEPHDLYEGVLLKKGDQIVCAGSNRLVSVGLPQYNRAVTTSIDGRTWYALCAPTPRVTEIWMKTHEHNTWIKLTMVKNQLDADFYEMVLSDRVCLYILKDGYRLECYNLSTQQWHQLPHSALQSPHLTFKLVKTGDGSLPLTMVANSQARHIMTCTYNQYQWGWDLNAMCYANPYLLDYETKPIFWHNVEDSPTGYYRSLFEQKPQPGLMAELLQQVYKETEMTEGVKASALSPIHAPDNILYLMTDNQALTAITDSGHSFCPQSLVKPTFIQYNTPLDPSDQWTEITAFKGALWGHTVGGQWLLYQNGAWNPVSVPLGGGGLWFNPRVNHLCRLACDNVGLDQAVLTVDKTQTNLNLFNPNYVDGSFVYTEDERHKYHPTPYLSGLKCLEHAKVSKNAANGLAFELQPGVSIPPALQLFLNNLDSEMSETLFKNNRDLARSWGGARHHTGDRLEIYTSPLDAASPSHMVLKNSLKQFFARYVDPHSVEIVGMGSTLIDKSTPHTLFHLRERSLECFVYDD
ncbi:protein ORF117 [Lake sturgeon herpesvirus]|nr:protein ORF117 [Lake sturgeon herpesvirus]